MDKNTLINSAHINYQYETLGTTIDLETNTNDVTTNIIEPKLSVLKTVNKSYFGPEDTITYNIYISNNALSTLYNIKIIESIDSNFEYVNNSAIITDSSGSTIHLQQNKINSGIPSITYEPKSIPPILEFKIDTLETGSNIMLSYSITLPYDNNNIHIPDSINSYSTVNCYLNDYSAQPFSIRSNTSSITKAFALLDATEFVDKETAFNGDTICYKILLNNLGNLDAKNVHISDQLPLRFRFNNVKFKIADLPYNISFNVDENNLLSIPAKDTDKGLCIPSKTDDNCILIYGTINND